MTAIGAVDLLDHYLVLLGGLRPPPSLVVIYLLAMFSAPEFFHQ